MTLPAVSALTSALAVLEGAPLRIADYRSCGSSDLVDVMRLASSLRQVAEAHLAAAAGEIERQNLAVGAGSRTTTELLKTTGMTGRDAATAVRIGRLTQGAGSDLDRVGSRVLEGSVSVAAADAIRAGLDGAAGVPSQLLEQASELLCDEAQRLDPDQLLVRAREVRDELDEAGIADREAVLRSRRSIRRIDCRDGMKRIIWDYDPETAGVIDEIYDRATSPRRGGPRFVDSEQTERAARIADDSRTVEQLASDAFTELLRQAATLGSDVLVGVGEPAVRVIVPIEALESEALESEALESGTGHGVIEASGEAVGIRTVERLVCANGIQTIALDRFGHPLRLGWKRRLFSRHQRVALAVRDGGCLWTNCERPPSWTEAHHIDPWKHGGRTDLDRGVLLCKHHHLRLHNEGWAIKLRAGRYWLEPPRGSGEPGVLLETKSRAIREHLTRTNSPPGTPSSQELHDRRELDSSPMPLLQLEACELQSH